MRRSQWLCAKPDPHRDYHWHSHRCLSWQCREFVSFTFQVAVNTQISRQCSKIICHFLLIASRFNVQRCLAAKEFVQYMVGTTLDGPIAPESSSAQAGLNLLFHHLPRANGHCPPSASLGESCHHGFDQASTWWSWSRHRANCGYMIRTGGST